jgi:hypothetical protein
MLLSSSHLTLGLSVDIFPSDFPTKRQYTIIFPLSTTYSNHPTYYELNKLTKFGEKYILRGNLLYVQPPPTSPFLSRYIP